jgi:hypothetical protein
MHHTHTYIYIYMPRVCGSDYEDGFGLISGFTGPLLFVITIHPGANANSPVL